MKRFSIVVWTFLCLSIYVDLSKPYFSLSPRLCSGSLSISSISLFIYIGNPDIFVPCNILLLCMTSFYDFMYSNGNERFFFFTESSISCQSVLNFSPSPLLRLKCQDPGPDKLYSTLTSRSSICAFLAVA